MSKEIHLALYRKYRPQTFDDVVGQDEIVNLLESAIKQKKVSHAYLFCGGRGTGKTSVARIFARNIGCNPEDIIEIDAASNRGIDEIRELREAVRTAPFSSPYKVYIVDEAHMLTKEAANALLKTLEEPPSHVIFILATTDPDKLPATIVSRCQKIVFSVPSLDTLSKRLSHVAQKEGRSLDESTALLIASHGRGSYRDAIGILEQVLTLGGKSIAHDTVASYLGAPEREVVLDLLTALCIKDEKGIVVALNILEKNNSRALQTYDELLNLIRQGLLIRVGGIKSDDERLVKISIEHATTIGSKLILSLLEKRPLLEVSQSHAWTAFLAVALLSKE